MNDCFLLALTVPYPPSKISFSSFRDNFSSGVTYLRRRFSSNDLQSDFQDEVQSVAPPGPPVPGTRKGPSPSAPSSPSKASGSGGGFARSIFSAMTSGGNSVGKMVYSKDRYKCLLVIDDQHTDW